MKDLEWYFGAAHSDICQPAIMNKTPATFTDPEIPTIIPDMGVERPKTDAEITYLKKRNINDAIRQKLRKKDVYETNTHKIFNIIVGHTNDQIQKKVALESTLQVVKTGRDHIGYLMILKKL